MQLTVRESPRTYSASIANNATDSDVIDLGGALGHQRLIAIEMPSSFTGTSLTFKVSAVASTGVQLARDENGSVITISCAANSRIVLTPSDWYAWRYVQVVSGSTEGGARVVKLVAA